jgi:hypothetical protein
VGWVLGSIQAFVSRQPTYRTSPMKNPPLRRVTTHRIGRASNGMNGQANITVCTIRIPQYSTLTLI